MTDIFTGTLHVPAAWTGASLGGKAALVREMDGGVLAALDTLASRLRGRPFPEITRQDASDPALVALMDDACADVMEGRGFVLLRGPDPARFDPEDYARVYWALGTHLGRGVVQSYFGDHVARVERNPDLPWRGTTTDMELRPHTDFHEVMSLASISVPESGGVSAFVSSLAIHNEIARTRSDLLKPLYEGWYNLSALHRTPSKTKVPIYCWREGKLSCFFNRVFYQKPEEAGEVMPAELNEALALMDEIAARPEMRAEFVLEPGEIVFWHNFQVLHARSAFKDSDTRRRLLLRLWLNVDEGRPMAEEIRERARIFDRDHVEGAVPAATLSSAAPSASMLKGAAAQEWPGKR